MGTYHKRKKEKKIEEANIGHEEEIQQQREKSEKWMRKINPLDQQVSNMGRGKPLERKLNF